MDNRQKTVALINQRTVTVNNVEKTLTLLATTEIQPLEENSK